MEYAVLDHARRFSSLVLPWSQDGTTPYCNLHWRTIGQNGKSYWDGRAASTLDEFIKLLAWALKQPDIKDIYACMSAQTQMEEKTSKRGYTYKKAVRSSNNVASLKSLFIDIDVKEGAYASTQDAVKALMGFITSTGMPKPSAVVASGSGGMHVHWALEHAISKADWQVLADALSRAVQQLGLICDTQCTVDAARILRIPETFNSKLDPAAPVKLLSLGTAVSIDDVRASLGKYIQAVAPVVIPIAANDDLGGGLVTQAKPIKIEDVAENCGFIKATLTNGGADNNNPLWFITTSIATFTEDSRESAHKMAQGHATYHRAGTDDLFDRLAQVRKDKDIGWPKCSKIAGSGAKECATCPLLSSGKSPLNFTLRAANDAPDSTLPDGYYRNQDGYVFRRAVDDSGASISIQICTYPMQDGWLSNSPWTLHFMTKTAVGSRAKLEIPTEVITAKDALGKYLGGKGFFVGEKQAKILKEFLLAWIQKLQNSKDSVVASAPFGWSIVDGKPEGFTFAGRVWTDGDDRPAANPDPVLSYQYTPKGSMDPWKEMAKILSDQRRPALDTIIASSFAAPLVMFTGQSGVMVNSYSSQSGIGKTTAMRCAQAVWGDPTRAMQQLDDTINSVMNKIGATRSLPLFWDELKTDAQTNKFVTMAFQLTSGREKTRLNSDSTLKASGSWQTILVSASNDSILDAMVRITKSTNAGIYRTFEYIVPPPTVDNTDHGLVTRLSGKLSNNYGHAGLEYAKFIGANYAKIEQDIAKLQDELYTELECINEERFWLATITVILQGAIYSNDLGLTDIDLPGLKAFLITVLGKMRDEVNSSPSDMSNDMSVSSILAQFLNAMRGRNTLITNKIWIAKGRPAVGSIKILNDPSRIDNIIVQIGREDGLVRISSTAFSAWMADHGYSRQTFTKKMKEEFGLKIPNGKLGGGTDIVGGMEYLLELDLNDHKLKDFVE